MSEIEVICLSPDEWPLYRAIRLEALQTDPQAFQSTYAETLQRPDAHFRMRLEESAEGKHARMFFARLDGRIVGIMGWFVEAEAPDVALVIAVFVSPSARGRGAGSAMMSALLEQLRADGRFTRARLTVNAAQSAAVALYRKFGFRVYSEETARMGTGQDALEYHMELALK